MDRSFGTSEEKSNDLKEMTSFSNTENAKLGFPIILYVLHYVYKDIFILIFLFFIFKAFIELLAKLVPHVMHFTEWASFFLSLHVFL